MAERFSKINCAALLLPHLPAQEGEAEELGKDDPSAESVERAQKKVRMLQGKVMAAKIRLRQLGGELAEDSEIELLKNEHQR